VITSDKIKAFIKLKSSSNLIPVNIILRSIIFEFFLEKLALSHYSKHFVLKGGFLVSSITNIELRTTMDLDVTLKSLSLNQKSMSKCLNEIIKIDTHEELSMELIKIEDIRNDADYPGLRATITVLFDGIKESIKIDFTTGDVMTPSEVDFHYKSILDQRLIKLKSYNIETILAEKMETIYSRGILNTRMRDYYDVYILWSLKQDSINNIVLKNAFNRTIEYRQTSKFIKTNMQSIIETIEHESSMLSKWVAYQQYYSYATLVSWNDIILTIKSISKVYSLNM
jgi:predicted nucleotidyltransferase component of viral defense system